MYKLSKKIFYPVTKNEKDTVKNKINKIWKRNYFLGVKDFTHSFRTQKLKMTNKTLSEKSNCVV